MGEGAPQPGAGSTSRSDWSKLSFSRVPPTLLVNLVLDPPK
jgi:hypothetical protein